MENGPPPGFIDKGSVFRYMLAAVFRCGAFFLKRGFSWLFLDAKSI